MDDDQIPSLASLLLVVLCAVCINSIEGPVNGNFLLVADGVKGNIFQVDPSTGQSRAIYNITASSKIYPTAIDYDPTRRVIYYVNEKRGSRSSGMPNEVCRQSIDDRDTSTRQCVDSPASGGSIAVFSGTPFMCFYVSWSKILPLHLLDPRGHQVNAFEDNDGSVEAVHAATLGKDNRVLFWAVCGTEPLHTIIKKATNTNRLGRNEVVLSNVGACARAIAVDAQARVLYWRDNFGDVRMANLNGKEIKLIYQSDHRSFTNADNPIGLAFDREFLYISDSQRRYIQKIDRTTYALTNVTGPVFSQLGNIKIHISESSEVVPETSESPSSVASSLPQHGLASVWIALVICASVVMVAGIAAITMTVLKMKRGKPKESNYEFNCPTPYACEEHYDTINCEDDDNQLQQQRNIYVMGEMQTTPSSEPDYHYINDA